MERSVAGDHVASLSGACHDAGEPAPGGIGIGEYTSVSTLGRLGPREALAYWSAYEYDAVYEVGAVRPYAEDGARARLGGDACTRAGSSNNVVVGLEDGACCTARKGDARYTPADADRDWLLDRDAVLVRRCESLVTG